MKNKEKYNNNWFIKKSNLKHNDRYNYSLVNYNKSDEKIKIICSIHGVFEQKPRDHIRGYGCCKCNKKEKLTTIIFIERAKLLHGNKYDYSLVNYKNVLTKVKIICSIHGAFKQVPSSHLQGFGCGRCGGTGKSSVKEFIMNANKIHKNKYDYSKVIYKGNKQKVKIICPIHGIFEKTPNLHLSQKQGCQKCGYIISASKTRKTTEEFINEANMIHGNKYNYLNTKYIHNKIKVTITCLKHGDFTQSTQHHLNGFGCSKCSESKGEKEVRLFLEYRNIKYISEKRFNNCRYKNPLPFDFYLPDLNICIEFNGKQHYEPIDWFNKNEGFKNLLIRDKIKHNYCKNNNIKLINIKYNEDIHKILKTNLI